MNAHPYMHNDVVDVWVAQSKLEAARARLRTLRAAAAVVNATYADDTYHALAVHAYDAERDVREQAEAVARRRSWLLAHGCDAQLPPVPVEVSP